ncbi:hypothetical protein DIPPA_29498 [Diplonema papillatum]|nr:hypothetical protein DIPPA_29498 [Diplonema papillatum]
MSPLHRIPFHELLNCGNRVRVDHFEHVCALKQSQEQDRVQKGEEKRQATEKKLGCHRQALAELRTQRRKMKEKKHEEMNQRMRAAWHAEMLLRDEIDEVIDRRQHVTAYNKLNNITAVSDVARHINTAKATAMANLKANCKVQSVAAQRNMIDKAGVVAPAGCTSRPMPGSWVTARANPRSNSPSGRLLVENEFILHPLRARPPSVSFPLACSQRSGFDGSGGNVEQGVLRTFGDQRPPLSTSPGKPGRKGPLLRAAAAADEWLKWKEGSASAHRMTH